MNAAACVEGEWKRIEHIQHRACPLKQLNTSLFPFSNTNLFKYFCEVKCSAMFETFQNMFHLKKSINLPYP